MVVRELRPKTVPAPQRPPASRSAADLASELIRHAKKTASPNRSFSGPLLDLEVDGVRCILVERKLTPPAVVLSPREQEIVRMVAKGYPSKTIAAVLEISIWTVSTHLRRVFAKTGVGSRAAMVAKLAELESLQLGPPSLGAKSKSRMFPMT